LISSRHSLNTSNYTFLGCLNRVVPLSLHLVLPVALHFSEIGALVVGSKIDHNLFIETRLLLLVLLHTALDNHVHVFVLVPLLVNLVSRFKLLEGRVVKYLPSFL
jgi:hypothetical protein